MQMWQTKQTMFMPLCVAKLTICK